MLGKVTRRAPKPSDIQEDTQDLEVEQVSVFTVDFPEEEFLNPLASTEEEEELSTKLEESASNSFEQSRKPVQIELRENWDQEAWEQRWSKTSQTGLVPELPPELEERLVQVLAKKGIDRNQFVLQAIEEACKRSELEELRKKGEEAGEKAILVCDPKTGQYRCFPANYFAMEELRCLQVISGKYYPVRWKKTRDGWQKVQSGYFQSLDQRKKTYIQIENGKAVGNWEEQPFYFFEHGWKWGVYDQQNILEVKGRMEEYGALYYDVYVNNERVDSVLTAQEVQNLIQKYEKK